MDLLARELGNWRTSSRSGPAYLGLADAIRMLIVDGRLPVGARLPSERALADTLRVSRTTVTAAYTQLREDGYLNARRGARSTTALPIATGTAIRSAAPATVSLAEATLAASAAAMMDAFADAAREVMPYLHDIGVELTGVPPLREAIAERYCARGLPTEPDEIMVTTGALHAIGLILATYTQPGDRVLVEQPTYHGALSAIMTTGARPVPVAMTNDGWELDAVHSAVRQLAPNLAYLVLDNHNPTGMTLSEPGRRRLGTIIAETRTRTIVDETIADMWLDRPVPAPMAAFMPSRRDLVLTIGSMSKSFWGGLRDRLDPRRAQHTGHHRRGAPVDRHGDRDRRTARRGTPLRQRRRAPRGAARDIASSAGLAENASARTSSRLVGQPEPRRNVIVGAAARTDQLRGVGGRFSARTRRAAGTALRCRRHTGAVHPGALHAARRPAGRGGGVTGPRLAQRDGHDGIRIPRCGGLALHQFAHMGADRIRKSLKVVTALQHRHQPTVAVLLRRFHQFACHPGEIVGRHAQRTERVALMGIEAGRDDDELRSECVERGQNPVLECLAQFHAAVACSERRIEDIAHPGLADRAGAREQRHLMRRGIEHARIGVEDLLRAVAVVDVEIDDRDPLQPVVTLRVSRADADVVEQAEPHRPFGFGVVARRTARDEGVLHFPVEHLVDGLHRAPTPRSTTSHVEGSIMVSPPSR